MSKYASAQFWIDTFDRGIATFAQSIAGVLVMDKVSVFSVDWQGALGLALAITGASVLTSIAFRGSAKSEVEK